MEVEARTEESPRQTPVMINIKTVSEESNFNSVCGKKRKGVGKKNITKTRTCEDCGYTFCSSSNLLRHKRDNRCGRLHTSRLSGSWNCPNCKYHFRFYPLYIKHLRRCIKKVEQLATSEIKLDMENKIADPKPSNKQKGCFHSVHKKPSHFPSKCKVCGVNFRSALHYKTHLSRKGYCRPRPFTCYNCGKIFDTIHHLIAHENRKSSCLAFTSSTEKMTTEQSEQKKVLKREGSFISQGNAVECTENKCEKCDLTFEFPYLYRKHMQSSSCAEIMDGKFADKVEYSDIGKNLRSKKPVSCHTTKKPSKRGYQCRKCGYMFSKVYRLRKHLNRKFPCVPLRQHFLTTRNRSARKTMPPARLQLEPCDQKNTIPAETTHAAENSSKYYKSVHSKILRKYHKITSNRQKPKYESDIKPPVCELCDKTFVSAKSFVKHMQLHPGFIASNHPVKCPSCPEIFSNPACLFKHQKAEKHWGSMLSRTRECECPFCGKEFLYIGRRNGHVRSIHMQADPKEAKKFLDETTCDVCFRQFVDASEKVAHIQSEHQGISSVGLEREYISTPKPSNVEGLSESVEKTPNNPENYKKSIETLTPAILALMKKYPTKCPFCFKMYSSCYVRDRHLKCHTKEKPFVCSWCNKCFARSEHLTRHYQQNHNDLLSFKCLGCGTKFPTRLQTIQHIGKAHSGVSRSSLLYEIKNLSPISNQPAPSVEILKEDYVKKPKPFHYPKPGLILSPDDTARGIYSCEICGIHNFTKMTALHRHRKSRFHRENLLLKQIKSNASKSLSVTRTLVSYKCSVCDVSYSSIATFVPHRLSHFQAQNLDPSEINECNPYSCEICQKTIDHHQKVQAHLLWHLQADRTPRFISSTDSDNLSQERMTLIDKKSSPSVTCVQSNMKLDVKIKTPENVAKKSIQPSKILQEKNGSKPSVEIHEPQVKTEEEHTRNFSCYKCQTAFSTKQHYTAHIRHYCPIKKNSKELLQSNFEKSCPPDIIGDPQSITSVNILTCAHCSLEFVSPEDLGWHEKSCRKVHSSERIDVDDTLSSELHQCRYCHCAFITLEICREHERAYCKKLQTCEECSVDFKSHQDLIDHIESFHGVNHQLKCYVCGQTFYSPRVLKKHIQSHEDDIAFNCLYCAAFFSDLKALFEHLESHEIKLNIQQHDVGLENELISSQAEPVKNSSLSESVETFESLSVEEGSKNKFQCPYCPRGYKDRAHYREHLVIHEPFHCKVCGKEENTVVGFRKHPCQLPDGKLATGILYRKSWGKKMIKLVRKKHSTSFNYTTASDTEFIGHEESKADGNDEEEDKIHLGSKHPTTTTDVSEKLLENVEKFKQEELDALRKNFSQLLFFLVADPELMEQLGWGQKLIDSVLDDVLQHMGQQPVEYHDSQSELERLRDNIQLLLKISIKDHVMDDVEKGKKVIDDLVQEMLNMCTSHLGEDSVDNSMEWDSNVE
ncbi:uncharacterized protein LOC143257027 [Tachypleus tridentatus]|uniref:uncharacterized protein LOC143257027 n=1 Tax=Tachypleus tridentatus TaxID=6853 RepID=UPI003FD43FF9